MPVPEQIRAKFDCPPFSLAKTFFCSFMPSEGLIRSLHCCPQRLEPPYALAQQHPSRSAPPLRRGPVPAQLKSGARYAIGSSSTGSTRQIGCQRSSLRAGQTGSGPKGGFPYHTRKCHDAIADRGAHAVVLPRKNASQGRPSLQVLRPEMRLCGRPNTLAARSGATGADTTDEAASKTRCTVGTSKNCV